MSTIAKGIVAGRGIASTDELVVGRSFIAEITIVSEGSAQRLSPLATVCWFIAAWGFGLLIVQTIAIWWSDAPAGWAGVGWAFGLATLLTALLHVTKRAMRAEGGKGAA